jgi:Aspartyl protease
MGLADFLHEAGYGRIALSFSGVGHIHAAATIAAHPVSALLDTGASNTVLSLTLARELGLPLATSEFQGGGAGSATMEVYFVEQPKLLRIGEVTPALDRLVVMDLGHVNQALAGRGEPPIQLILGVDVFTAHHAVIDYGSSSLFLKRNRAE